MFSQIIHCKVSKNILTLSVFRKKISLHLVFSCAVCVALLIKSIEEKPVFQLPKAVCESRENRM